MSRNAIDEAVLDDLLTPKPPSHTRLAKPAKREATRSSDALKAMTLDYKKTNNALEKSLDETEDRYPTRAVVRERILRIEQDIARTTKAR